MTSPVRPLATQSRHPRRATFRTIVAAIVGFLPLLPFIVETFGIGALPWVVSVLAVAGGVTRVLASPAVEAYLRQHASLSWLAAQPRTNNENGVPQ